jgi:hypothetical protein
VRLAALADEQETLLTTASIAFEFLKTGTVGIGGATGTLLGESLKGLRALHDRVVAELRSAAATREPGGTPALDQAVGHEVPTALLPRSKSPAKDS